MNDLRYSFSCIDFLNYNEKYKLYIETNSIYDIFSMSKNELTQLSVKTGILTDKLLKTKEFKIQTYNYNKYKNVELIDIYSNKYPYLLKQTFGAPIVLYCIGNIPQKQMISIVGSRNPSEYGKRNAYILSDNLSLQGYCITSGMAKGIDGIGHMAAIKNEVSLAVLGNGIDICYPECNRFIYNNLLNNGCIISEYPPGTKPQKRFCPQRNRIISGLSFCTIIIEASERSGSLITANLALSQNREVYCLPNLIDSGYNGTNCLIKDGAGIITDIGQFCQELKAIEISWKNLYDCKSSLGGNYDKEPGNSGITRESQHN